MMEKNLTGAGHPGTMQSSGIYTDEFDVLHYAAVADLRVRK